MERESKKRGREGKGLMTPAEEERERGASGSSKKAIKHEAPDAFLDDVASAGGGGRGGADRPLGVFEFPWQAEGLVAYSEGCDLRDVFFSSLVDGCSAAIGLPGDRLFRAPAAIVLPDEREEGGGARPSDGGDDAVDCIWSCVLSQPLTAVDSEASSA